MANTSAASNNPLFMLPLTLSGSVARSVFVKADGSAVPSAGGDALGVTLEAGISGQQVDVIVLGCARMVAGGTLHYGDRVSSDASGNPVAATALSATLNAGGSTDNNSITLAGSQTPGFKLGWVASQGTTNSGSEVIIFVEKA